MKPIGLSVPLATRGIERLFSRCAGGAILAKHGGHDGPVDGMLGPSQTAHPARGRLV
jgi:hypothetical protein